MEWTDRSLPAPMGYYRKVRTGTASHGMEELIEGDVVIGRIIWDIYDYDDRPRWRKWLSRRVHRA